MVEEGRQYIIINKISPLALTLTDDDDGLVLASKPRNGRNDQKWIPIREEDGLWALKSVAYGKFLATAGQPIVGAKLIGANSQTRWEIIGGPQGPKFFRIFIPFSPLTVGVPGDGHFPHVVPVELQEDTRQTWRFVEAEPF